MSPPAHEELTPARILGAVDHLRGLLALAAAQEPDTSRWSTQARDAVVLLDAIVRGAVEADIATQRPPSRVETTPQRPAARARRGNVTAIRAGVDLDDASSSVAARVDALLNSDTTEST